MTQSPDRFSAIGAALTDPGINADRSVYDELHPDVFVSGPRLELFSVEQERRIRQATGGEMDFVSGVSELYPLTVILAILGLPSSEAGKLLSLTPNFTRRETMPVPAGKTREDLILQGSQDIFDYFGAIYDERLLRPQ